MKRFPLLRMGALAAAVVCLAPPIIKADENDKKTVVTFDQPTEVPGIVLPPGKYVIKLLTPSTNRHIAEIMNERMDHLYALTFVASAERLDRGDPKILTFYEGKNGQPQAIHNWFWPGESIGSEFLYPKDQAAKIASLTNQKVAEGNLPTVAESGQSFTPDNARGLSVESTQQSAPAATPVIANATQRQPAPAPTVIAQNTPPPTPARPVDTSQTSPAAVSNTNSSTTNASNTNSPADTTLPQTASSLPLIGAIGVMSLLFATLMASIRRNRSLS